MKKTSLMITMLAFSTVALVSQANGASTLECTSSTSSYTVGNGEGVTFFTNQANDLTISQRCDIAFNSSNEQYYPQVVLAKVPTGLPAYYGSASAVIASGILSVEDINIFNGVLKIRVRNFDSSTSLMQFTIDEIKDLVKTETLRQYDNSHGGGFGG